MINCLTELDSLQEKEIFFVHPFKNLILYLKTKYTPFDCIEKGIDLCDFYFSLLDDYNKFDIICERPLNTFLDNTFIQEINKVKKINLNKLDKEKKPLSNWELKKRKAIKEQKNVYLQIAMMHPNVYNNDKFFEDSINGILDDYNGDFQYQCFLMFVDEKEDEYFKKKYKILIDMIKNIDDLIEKSDDYLYLNNF